MQARLSQANLIRPFTFIDWHGLWTVRLDQLATYGIMVDPATIPAQPEPVSFEDYEWDFHRIETVYLQAPGNFWLAWDAEKAIGMVGAQPIGSCIELRRMYVAPTHRRKGIGTQLVRALLDHCRIQNVPAVELWTERNGQGEALYTHCGFRRVPDIGGEYTLLQELTRYQPDANEVRMRIDLL